MACHQERTKNASNVHWKLLKEHNIFSSVMTKSTKEKFILWDINYTMIFGSTKDQGPWINKAEAWKVVQPRIWSRDREFGQEHGQFIKASRPQTNHHFQLTIFFFLFLLLSTGTKKSEITIKKWNITKRKFSKVFTCLLFHLMLFTFLPLIRELRAIRTNLNYVHT